MAEDSQLELEGITAAGQSTSLDGRIQRELVRVALFGDDEVGPRVGRFAIEERLGAGASAVVYAASDPELGRRVAIKILSRRDDTGRQLIGVVQRDPRRA